MRADARAGQVHWVVFDLDRGEKIPLCIWADDETGEYEHLVPDAKGQMQRDPNDRTQILKRRGQGRIILVPPDGALPVIVEGK
jgi:hypothetical protein